MIKKYFKKQMLDAQKFAQSGHPVLDPVYDLAEFSAASDCVDRILAICIQRF
jgi:hypothetical protein